MSNNAVFQNNWSESLLHESQPLDNSLDLKSWLCCNFIFSLAIYTYSVGVGGRRDQFYYLLLSNTGCCSWSNSRGRVEAVSERVERKNGWWEGTSSGRSKTGKQIFLVHCFSQNLNLVQTLLFHPKAKEHTSHERPPALERAQPYLTLSIVYCCKKYCFASHNFFPTQCKRLPITFIISVTRSSVIIIRHFISTEYLRRHTGIM